MVNGWLHLKMGDSEIGNSSWIEGSQPLVFRGSVQKPFANGWITRSHGTVTSDIPLVGEASLKQFVGMLTYG